MRVMSTTNSKRKTKQTVYSSRGARERLKSRRKKRKLSCSSVEEFVTNERKKQKRDSVNNSNNNNYFYEALCSAFPENSFFDPRPNERFVIEEQLVWSKVKPPEKQSRKTSDVLSQKKLESVPGKGTSSLGRKVPCPGNQRNAVKLEGKCWIHDLPQEILLKIFSYLPLGMLLHTIPQICRKWEILSLDWTLWKTVEDLTIKNMVISTAKLKSLLRTIPKLKKLELISRFSSAGRICRSDQSKIWINYNYSYDRNDTEELLHELFETHQNLEVLKLDRCYRSTLQMNMLSQTVTSILELCPKLKTVILTDTYFHSKNFYRCLAKKFRTIDRINVTCTSKSEMDIFMENLKESVSEVEFQKVPMMGRAAGKQIYWGPILGLVVRPIPTSPFHQQYIHDNYPNYAF